ncbi:MAG TPA: imidazoleglycerol-phosphate dehydratase HisB [Methanoculleus sp.]|nr:imidazoleglycerol-phosphate dehydratase HisB [Methanoculleus sp.]
MRTATIERVTKETTVSVTVALDDHSATSIATGIGFLDHMLTACARHGSFGLAVHAKGDLDVDSHHTIEDIGIVMGRALSQALGDKKGIARFASVSIPMDEALATAVLDVGGRGYLVMNGTFAQPGPGQIPPDLFEHFFYSLCINAGITAHLSFTGKNDHHKCEALFKAFGIALGRAVAPEPGSTEIPSTKGVL